MRGGRSEEQIRRSTRHLGRSEGQVRRSEGHLGRSEGRFSRSTRHLGRSEGQVRRSEGHLGLSEGRFSRSAGHLGRSEGQFNRSAGHLGLSEGQFGRSEGHLGRSEGRFRRSEEHLSRSEVHFDRCETGYAALGILEVPRNTVLVAHRRPRRRAAQARRVPRMDSRAGNGGPALGMTGGGRDAQGLHPMLNADRHGSLSLPFSSGCPTGTAAKRAVPRSRRRA